MIEPTEVDPNAHTHPMWKRNVFAALLLCVLGVVMMVSVSLFIYGAAIFALGMAWAVGACIVGIMQERAEARAGGAQEQIP